MSLLKATMKSAGLTETALLKETKQKCPIFEYKLQFKDLNFSALNMWKDKIYLLYQVISCHNAQKSEFYAFNIVP